MKLSKKSEYACLALIDLSENYSNDYIKIIDIANNWSIPKKFLEQILLILKTSGYVKSKKGSDGGYKLIKNPEQITLAEIIRLMDGALAPVESASKYFYENTPIEQHKKLINIFIDIRDYISDKLENITFGDLIK
ncbi:MAG TPA: Rrf2 family transcriptional regulator [Bacteroidales bacterium]|nr:Rrf2 family transcriptional regulator [Bacteroidales bacterium]